VCLIFAVLSGWSSSLKSIRMLQQLLANVFKARRNLYFSVFFVAVLFEFCIKTVYAAVDAGIDTEG